MNTEHQAFSLTGQDKEFYLKELLSRLIATQDYQSLRRFQNYLVLGISLLFIILASANFRATQFVVYFLVIYLFTVLMNLIYIVMPIQFKIQIANRVNFNVLMGICCLILISYL